MRSWNGIALSATFLLSIIAGCTEGADGEGTTQAVNDARTASIGGRVLDDTLLPIEKARVALLTPDGTAVYRLANTTAQGEFVFDFVPAGEYMVEAKASGHNAAMKLVSVEAGQALKDVSFTLEPGFADVAYFVTDSVTRTVGGGTVKYGFHCAQTPWAPYVPPSLGSLLGKHCVGGNICAHEAFGCSNVASGCNGSYSTETGAEDNGYGGSSYVGGYRDLLLRDPNWKTQLAEVTWQPSSSVSGRGVLFEILGPNVTNSGSPSRCGGINQSDPRDFLVVSDEPPFRIEITDALLQARGIAAEDRCCDWRWRLFPGWCDLGNCARWGPDVNALGIVAPTRVDVYYTIFFKEQAPPGWSTLPDQ